MVIPLHYFRAMFVFMCAPAALNINTDLIRIGMCPNGYMAAGMANLTAAKLTDILMVFP